MKIIIKYNRILDEITRAHSLTMPKHVERAKQETDMAAVNEMIRLYKEAESMIRYKTHEAIERMAKRPFPYSTVNVNIVWVVYRTESQGMIFPVTLSPDGFIISLTHELMHLAWPLYTDEFIEKYGKEEPAVRDHIIVHAMLEYLWRDVIGRPDYVDKSKAKAGRHSTGDYSKAWAIVESEGYMKVLDYIRPPKDS